MSDQGQPLRGKGPGRPSADPFPASRGAAPPPREMHVKVSAYGECLAGPRGVCFVEGWEEGLVQEERQALVSPPPVGGRLGSPGRPLAGLEAWARRLRDELAAALPARAGRVHARVGRARVEESVERPGGPPRHWKRIIATGEALLGENPDLPAWSRVTMVEGPASGWPPGFVPAVARAVAGPADATPGAERSRGTPLAVDVFALADMLRAEAAGWAIGHPRPGSPVASPAVAVDDPGFPFPASPVDRDGEGEPVRPFAVVRDGRLLLRPRTLAEERRGEGRSTGSAVRPSWRAPGRAGWRFLRLDVRAPVHPWPDRVRLVTRTMLAGGHLLVGGVLLEGGCPRARWGLVPAPPPRTWLREIVAPLGIRVPDGSGVPVAVPPVLVAEDLLG